MKKDLLKVSLRAKALYIPNKFTRLGTTKMKESTLNLVVNAKKMGYTFSEPLVHALNGLLPIHQLGYIDLLKEVMGAKKNWTPLVKDWLTPTGESTEDHFLTLIANVFGMKRGTRLACGHLIPRGTFPLERYNGCPFCGTPFELDDTIHYGQGSKLKVLEYWNDEQLHQYFSDLLQSKTALDATQVDSLKILLAHFPLKDQLAVGMKETLMLVIDTLIEADRAEEAGYLFKIPNDILRYLWYKHTGFLQIIQPKTIIKRKAANHRHIHRALDQRSVAHRKARTELKLKYSRKECRRVAQWLNSLRLPVEQACENMHPKRGMWIRFIRALRLSEYSKRKGYEYLAELLQVFHDQTYTVWQGRIEQARLKADEAKTFMLLKKRPGLFARSLFANMLWFGAETTIKHFRAVSDHVPTRLVLTLNMYANHYFDKRFTRVVRPLGGTRKKIPANRLLEIYNEKQLEGMKIKIEDLSLGLIQERFYNVENKNQTMYIDDTLYHMPLMIGDRSETVQDIPAATMGLRFPVEGDRVRLFMQWGVGMMAQHLDMDLSCAVTYPKKVEYCSYSNLNIPGCKHSGDIRSIPNMKGTAEYIELDLDELASRNAQYVTFTCNAYSRGRLSPNMVVGWMNSSHPMKVSEQTGVAFDPSCVQHQVRVTKQMSKGLVFGVLDVQARQIIWLEMNFAGQTVQKLDVKAVESLLAKLSSKMNIGHLLLLKAEAQQLEVVTAPEQADEVYDMKWAMNTAAVTQLFVD